MNIVNKIAILSRKGVYDLTDKTFERATQIKDELFKLELLKKELKKCIHLSVDVSRLEIIRKPFMDAVDSVVAQLKEEYENL